MPIRIKLSIGLLIIILSSNILLALVTSLYVNTVYFEEVQTRVRLDLNSARNIYSNSIDQIEQVLGAISIRRYIPSPIEAGVKSELTQVLQNLYKGYDFDILMLIGNDGRVIYRAHNQEKYGDDVSGFSLVGKALEEGCAINGTMEISNESLGNESLSLAKKAIVRIEDTPKAIPSMKEVEKRGMVIGAVVPFISLDKHNRENKLGLLFGGKLLNNHFNIVDKIKSEVFQGQFYQGEDIGTATIFFDDIRISTNVRTSDGQRAVGSRMSAEVYDHVINNGLIWADRAFVVNNWYITTYEPINDPEGKIIGSLYVGLLEEPFREPQRVIIIFFIIMICVSTIASVIMMLVYTGKLLKPMDNIIGMSKKVIDGDLTARSGISPSGEMGILCRSIDHMAEAIEQREEELQKITQQQISQSEKLASIGRLSAGIAHEINNPLTGVLTFAHLLKQKRNNDLEDVKDLDTIIRETTRVREIVKGLLDFARQTPFKKEYHNINDILRQITKLIKSQKEFNGIAISENFKHNIPQFFGDKNQLQQVFLNIILNAGEAITGKGEIKISTDVEDNKIVVRISDNGCGITKDSLDKIYDPFFTTKAVGKGTGLGLSISYGIIQQHDGLIKCKSEAGVGTTFSIYLPLYRQVVNERIRQ